MTCNLSAYEVNLTVFPNFTNRLEKRKRLKKRVALEQIFILLD
jgi:hypothetical protein